MWHYRNAIIRDNYEKLYAHKLDNLECVNIETYYLPRLNQ